MTPVRINYNAITQSMDLSWADKKVSLLDGKEPSQAITTLVEELKKISKGDGDGGLISEDPLAPELFKQIQEADAAVE